MIPFRMWGPPRRNEGIRLEDPHPVPRYDDPTYSGDQLRDGYQLLSRADPRRQGDPPPVKGQLGPVYDGMDRSFEQ